MTLRAKTEADLGARQFSYAVIADTHINHQERASNSIYPVNRLHNARFRHVVSELNRHPDIAFVIHLGDLVHPVPAIPDLYVQAAQRFKALVDDLRVPLYLVPGNHDVGDKTCAWTPAVCVQPQFIDLYREHFGDDYFAFEHLGLHFVQLNVQLLNSGLAAEEAQRLWIEEYFEAHRAGRFFVNIHYPVYLFDRHEDPHYDNLDEPGRSWLLELMERYAVEALFAGHVHHFWYQRHDCTDCYYLPSTAFTRQDYSEMSRSPPGADMEGGRDDSAKNGYLLVHVHERGHFCQVIRTYGVLAEEGAQPRSVDPFAPTLHPLQNWRDALGFDMRQDWMEPVQVPPSGGPDDFNRKRARNDYPLMALWEMGVRRLRIPKMDLQECARLERLRALRDHGQDFVLYSYGIPEPGVVQILVENPGLISACEIIFPWYDLDATLTAAKRLKEQTGVPIFLGRLRSKDDHGDAGASYVHAINYGFSADDGEQLRSIAAQGGVDGVVFRIAGNAAVAASLQAVSELCASCGLAGSAILRMSKPSPADYRQDDLWVANRVAEALAVAIALKNIRVNVDTFADIDRGYFRCNGVVDRHYNPRPGFHVIRNLYAACNASPAEIQLESVRATADWQLILLRRENRSLLLALPAVAGAATDALTEIETELARPVRSILDLVTAETLPSIPASAESPLLIVL